MRQQLFAYGLIDQAGVDVVRGHSLHHVKGIGVYRDRSILYGCGDFLSDYEGIEGHEDLRDDLGLVCFVRRDPGRGTRVRLETTPTRLRRFRVDRASGEEARWQENVLNREGRGFGTRVIRDEGARLTLQG